MKFFLTGATGFIGSHLTQALLDQGHYVTMLLHRATNADDLAQNVAQIRTVKLDILDTQNLVTAMTDHDVVIHLAYGSTGSAEMQYQITVEGTKSVFNAAVESGIKRFIHMSTISVYGEPPKTQTYTEKTPHYASLGLYSSLKQEAELAVLTLARQSTEVVVLQPGIVYGPGGSYWTAGLLKIFKDKFFPLINNGEGLCNLVHVFDVVDAIILAAMIPGIDGESFIITGKNPICWSTFFEEYEQLLGHKISIRIPVTVLKKYNTWKRLTGKSKEYKFYFRILSKLLKIRRFPHINKPIQFIDNQRIDFFAAKPHFSNEKARNVLGFNPKVSLQDGMLTVEKWYQASQDVAPNS